MISTGLNRHSQKNYSHSSREQRKSCTKRAPHQIIPRIHASDVRWIRIPQITQHSHEQQKGADREERTPNNRHDPMHTRSSRPTKPKQTHRYKKTPHHRRNKPQLRVQLPILIELRLQIPMRPPEERRHDDKSPNQDPQERQPLRPQTKPVDPHEHDGKRLEPDVQQAVHERDVHVQEEDDGLAEAEREGPDEHHGHDLAAAHVLRFDFGLALQVGVVGGFAHALRPPVEDVAAAGFGEEEDQEDEAGAREPG